MRENFATAVDRAVRAKGNPCVVGIDPAVQRISPILFSELGVSQERIQSEQAENILYAFGKLVIDAVADLVPVVKPQSAYYEVYGSFGMRALEKTIQYAKQKGLLVVLDAKRGDIAETSEAYAEAYLGELGLANGGVDCITLNPYLGPDSIEPFAAVAQRTGKGIFVCVRTSNPGGAFIQSRLSEGKPIYAYVSEMIASMQSSEDRYGHIGAVVGATVSEEAKAIRKLLPRSIFLVPGLGAQGGSPDTVRSCFDEEGMGALVNSSRGIIFPKGNQKTIEELVAQMREATHGFIKLVQTCRQARL